MASMTASPAIVRIDPGEIRMTGISYETEWPPPLEAFLWERLIGEDWRRIDPLEARVLDVPPEPDKKGFFLQELKPGQIYQVRMYHDESIDPNQPDTVAPDAEARALGLLRGPGPVELITFEEKGPGGTFFVWNVRTDVDTVAFMQIGTRPPVTDGEGFQSFNPGSVLASDTDGVSGKSHNIEIASESLLPGNQFHALLLVIDGEGNWQVVHHEFITRKRRVKIGFDEIHVINDGDDGHNEARFTNWIVQGDRIRNTCVVPEREITDSPSPGEEHMEHIPLGFHCGLLVTLGPEKITSANRSVAILTRGVAPVTIGSDEKSGNFLPGPDPDPHSDKFTGTMIYPDALFPFPIGSKREVVKDEPFEVTARPFTVDDDLMYSVRVLISVDYR